MSISHNDPQDVPGYDLSEPTAPTLIGRLDAVTGMLTEALADIKNLQFRVTKLERTVGAEEPARGICPGCGLNLQIGTTHACMAG